jgi:hypothetical protein
MVAFFELKNGIPDEISSVHRSLPDAKRCPCKRGEMKVILQLCNIAKSKEQSSIGLLEVKGDCG